MYKTLRFTLVSLLMMLCGTAFADESKLTFTAACNGTGTADDGVVWTVTSDGDESNFDNTKGIHYGTGSKAVGNITLTTSGISGTITSVVVNASVANGVTATVDVTVGGNAFGGDAQALSTTATDYTFEGSASGDIVVKVKKPSSANKALYVKSIVVTYADGENPPAETVATPVITPNGGTFFDQTEATITCETEGAQIFYTMNGETPNSTNSPMYGRALPINETLTLKAIAVKGEAVSAVASATFTKVESYETIAALNALENNTPFKFTGEAFVVAVAEKTTKSGTAKYVYIHDNSGNSLIYDATSANTADVEAGRFINPNWTGKVSIYKNLFEVTPDQALTVGVSKYDVSYPDFSEREINKVVSLKDVDSVTVNGSNLTIYVKGADKSFQESYDLAGYNQFGIEIPAAEEGKLYEIIGAVGKYNDNLQFWPIEIKEQTAEPQPEPDPDFYVVGSMTSWAIDANNKMTMQEIVENEQHIKEFTLDMTLAANDQFKVVSSTDGENIKSWFPAEGDNYVIEEAGDYTIYCRPNLDGGKGWFANCLKAVKKEAPQPVEPVYIETDLTAQFPVDYDGWAGATGFVGRAAPEVTTNDGRKTAACEKYESTCANTGDVFTRTLTGLTNGTYRIELYGAAAFTPNRGFDSTLEEGDDACVYLYAETAAGQVKQYIPAHVADNFNGSGIATAVLDNVEITDGTVKLGMYKDQAKTNWHVIQFKGVTAKVNAVELHTNVLAAARAALAAEENAAVTGEERTALEAAIKTNATVAEQTADAYKAAIAALESATKVFTDAKAAYEALADANALIVDLPYASAEKKPEAKTANTAEAAATAAAEVMTALRAYYESNALAEGLEGAEVLAEAIVNPAAEDEVNGWTTTLGEGSGGSIIIRDGEPWTDAAGNTAHKYFDGGDWGSQAWDVTFSQNITLEAGKYLLSAISRASGDVAQYLFAGTDSVKTAVIGATGGIFDRGWNIHNVEFEVKEAGNVEIGVRGVTEKQYNWMSFSDFRLVQLEKQAIEVTKYTITVAETENGTVEADKAEAAAGETVSVTVTPAEGYMVDEAYWSYFAEDGNIQKNEFTEPEEGNTATFIMPAANVTITFTFKEASVEPVVPIIAATLVHTAGTGWASATGKNTVDGEAEYYNNDAETGWGGAAFAEFDMSALPKTAIITKATLTWTTVTGGRANTNRDNKVYFLNAGQTVDYEAIKTTEEPRLYTNDRTFIENYVGQNTFEGTMDVTEAIKAIRPEQTEIIFLWTANTASATLAGKASEKAPTLVIEYAPGAPEIVNASFDANAEDVITVTTQGYQRNIPEGSDQITGLQPVTGWTPGTQTESDPGFVGGVFAYGSENLLNNKVAAPANAPENSTSPSALGLSAVWGGVAQYTQEVTAPEGDYKLSYTVYNGANTGAVTKNLFGFIAADGTEYLSDVKTFTVGEWATYDVTFTLDKETTGKISVGFIGSGGSGNAPHLFVDNVALVKVPGIEVALKELEKAIAAAQEKAASYLVGEGLFMYVASEIEPLTSAITTAQDAYRAAESKETVETATATLIAFIETFAPKATAPDADKAYTFELRLGGETPLYMALTEEGITIAEEATPLKFIAIEGSEGQYNLSNEDGTLFVGLAGNNAWTMSTLADKKAAWTFTALPDGAYRINNLVTAGRFVGTNAADKAAGSPCYADKQTSNGNVDWMIAEYVAPEPEVKTFDGYVAVLTTLQGNPAPGSTIATEAQTVKIVEGADNMAAVTFSGFSVAVPTTTFPEFTFNANVTDGEAISYTAVEGSKIEFKNAGGMSLTYNLTGEGTQATTETAPVFKLQIFQNPMMVINVVFAATAEDASAALQKATGINGVKSNAIEGTVYNLNGQKVEKTRKGLYIINGKKVVIK